MQAGANAGIADWLPNLLRYAVVALLALALELCCRAGVIPAAVMIAPSQMFAHLGEILVSGKFNADIRGSLGNIAIASMLAVLLGFLAGLLIHALPSLRRAIEPLLTSYYAIPIFIFYPVFIVMLGVGPLPIIAIGVLQAIVAMVTSTLNGLDRIPNVMRKSARMLRMSRWRTALYIHLPAASPYLFTGVKLAVAYAFIGVIASEFILSGAGIGYAIAYAYNNFENRDMYALMLLVLLLAIAANMVLSAFDKRFQARRQP
ncbi:ABC transporter permease subunit [Oxalobacteraceae bacterium CAVE-383]|nr:ABC transporter permease subunit [Oxalobacteraceae bacterium CAVE-383]